MRYDAIVARPQPKPVTRHFVGLPPELTEGHDHRRELPPARILLIRCEPGGGVILDRLAADGSVAGDTWHPTLQDAIDQAKFEYGTNPDDWREIPVDVTDIERFAMAQLLKADPTEGGHQ